MSCSSTESITIDEIEKYLAEVRMLIQENRIHLSTREKNKKFLKKARMRASEVYKIVSSLTYFDFCKTLKNDTNNSKYVDEVLYVFTKTIEVDLWSEPRECQLYIKLNLCDLGKGKRTIIVSFHECEYELTTKF
ncbi:MAG: type II toxin-antitoxin system MqsR family toxin [Clostridia bacterium]|nr:type II toxin-antitoxin system MqsR family toxin [Clostridia bacterium]